VDRGLAKQISFEQMRSGIDLIWGANEDAATEKDALRNGWQYITTKEEMDALTPGTHSFGQFSSNTWWSEVPEDDPSPTLQQMGEKAIELLNADNENGFFLMIEGAHIDKNSHRTEEGVDFPKKISDAAWAVKGFDNMIRTAVDFAKADGHTLVVITADHETGDLYMDNGRYTFHSGSHTGKNVPLIVYGADDLFSPGEAVENRSIPGRIAEKLGWNKLAFPALNAGKVPQVFWAILTLKPLRDLIFKK
jgi:alkaline phosphatase